MSTLKRPLEVDTGRIFRWSFFIALVLLQGSVWMSVRQRPARLAARRPMFALHGPGNVRSVLLGALVISGGAALAAKLATAGIATPLLGRWLQPAYDPSAWAFHLPAGETPLATAPARLRRGGWWRPGALVLTRHRVWFMPSAWDAEPWSLDRAQLDRIEPDIPAAARWLPVSHWPDLLQFHTRSGEQASVALADPASILAWFAPTGRSDGANGAGVDAAGNAAAPASPPGSLALPQGVFDA